MRKKFYTKRMLLTLLPGVLLPAIASAQYSISNIYNQGSSFSSARYAETVRPGAGGLGYRAANGGIFRHGGPAAATLTVTGPGTIYDAYSASPLTPGVDYFNGYDHAGSAVEIAGDAAPRFGNLHFSNGPGNPVTISNTAGIDVGGQLSMESGVITTLRATAAAGAIRLGAQASISATAPGDAQYVNGYMSKTGSTDFTFPVGSQDGTDLRILSVSGMSAASNEIAVAYWAGDPGTALDPTGGAHSRSAISPAGTPGSTQITTVSPIGFWDWVPVSGTDAVTVSVSLPDFSAAGGYANPAAMRLIGWNTAAGQWENLGGTSGAASNAEGATLSGTMTDMSQYSALGVGSVGGMPLPVQLSEFTAAMDAACVAQLSWKASSKSAAQFELQFSRDGASFSNIAQIAADGAADNYQYAWAGQPAGVGYYRVKAVAADGKAFFSGSQRLNSDCGSAAISVAPNPAEGEIRVSGMNTPSQIRLISALGQTLQSRNTTETTERISLSGLQPGIYIVEVIGGSGTGVSRFRIVKR